MVSKSVGALLGAMAGGLLGMVLAFDKRATMAAAIVGGGVVVGAAAGALFGESTAIAGTAVAIPLTGDVTQSVRLGDTITLQAPEGAEVELSDDGSDAITTDTFGVYRAVKKGGALISAKVTLNNAVQVYHVRIRVQS